MFNQKQFALLCAMFVLVCVPCHGSLSPLERVTRQERAEMVIKHVKLMQELKRFHQKKHPKEDFTVDTTFGKLHSQTSRFGNLKPVLLVMCAALLTRFLG